MKLFLLSYADDIAMLSESETWLKKGLDILEEYCDRWKLQVNVKTPKVLLFRKGRIRQDMKFIYKEECLDMVDNFRYLGVIFYSREIL